MASRTLHDLACWVERCADALERASVRHCPRPLRFENSMERMFREMGEEHLRRFAKDLLFYGTEPLWLSSLPPGQPLVVRCPPEYEAMKGVPDGL